MYGAFLAIVAFAAAALPAAELVQEFEGTGTTTTREFDVQAPWLLDWRLLGDDSFAIRGQYSQKIALEIMLVEARTGRYVGRVTETRAVGDGLRLFNESGRYQLRVSTTLGRWRIRIEQLTPEEAEAYEPADTEPENPFFRNQK